MWRRANLLILKVELCEVDHSFAPAGRVIMLHNLALFSWKDVPAARKTVSSTNADLSSLGSGDGEMRLVL